MALQASKAAFCAIVLLLAVLLALSGVMLGGTVLAGQSLWGSRAKVDVEPRQPCGAAGQAALARHWQCPSWNVDH